MYDLFCFIDAKRLIVPELAAAVAQWVRAFARQAEGWVFKSQSQLCPLFIYFVTAPQMVVLFCLIHLYNIWICQFMS